MSDFDSRGPNDFRSEYYIPMVVERTGRGERSWDIYSRLLEDRIIFIGSPIGDGLANAVIAQLLYLQKADKARDIHMYVNSPGGSISAGLAISALTLYLFVRTVDPATVAASLREASWPLLLASIAIGYFGHLSLRARRWGTMLAPLKADVGYYNLFSTTAIGYAISWLTPGRIGEVVRPVLLARRESIPVAGVLATAVIERLLDVAAIVVLAACAALSAPFWWQASGRSHSISAPVLGEIDLVRTLAWMGAAGLAASAAGFLVLRGLVREHSAFLRWVDRREARRDRLTKFWSIVRHGAMGASFLRSPGRAVRVGVESLSIWFVIALSCWIGLLAARVRIPFPGSFLIVAVSAVGIAVPTPGARDRSTSLFSGP